MSPVGEEHGMVELNLGAELRAFVRKHRLGRVVGGEVGIYTQRDPDHVRAADIVFIAKGRASDRPRKGFLEIAPDLVVEVISPSDRWQNVFDKIEEYFAAGVQWVWIVEPQSQSVRAYRSPTDVEKLTEHDILRGEGPLAEFAIPVAEIFAD